MRYHPSAAPFFAANLLALLEAISLGLTEGTEEEKRRAFRTAAKVSQTESRKWRIHRRPSPGPSRSLRELLSILAVLATLCGFAGPAEAGVCPDERRDVRPGCGGTGLSSALQPELGDALAPSPRRARFLSWRLLGPAWLGPGRRGRRPRLSRGGRHRVGQGLRALGFEQAGPASARRRPRPWRSKLLRQTGLSLLLVFALCLAVESATCDRAGCGTGRQLNGAVCFTPARPVSLSGELKAVDPNPLPRERDTTSFDEFREPYWSRPWFFGLDIENGWIFAGLGHGIGIWDARTDPAKPRFVVSRLNGPGGGFPGIPPGEHSKIVFTAIDAPDDSVAVLAGYSGAGTVIYDVRNKQFPIAVYQHELSAASVYATTLQGTRYAFVASAFPAGVFIYNLDRALTANGCFDQAVEPAESFCHGVLAGKLNTVGIPYVVHGTGNYLVVSFGSSNGFEVYDVSNPASPVVRLTALRDSSARSVEGVALWNQGPSYYVGARLSPSLTQGEQTAIYDVTCITSSRGCTELGAPLAVVETPSRGSGNFLTFSRANGVTPFLYAGTDASCGGEDGKQREWLFDVTDPSRPRDVTPTVTVSAVGLYNGVPQSKKVSYWSYYYRGSPTGFNLVAPHAGKFSGPYFYRAARSIFDIHLWTKPAKPPVASFQYAPAVPAPGELVQLQSTATEAPTSLSWNFPGGAPSFATGASASTRWSRPGLKKVTHSACNKAGCNSISMDVGVATFGDVPPSYWAWGSIEALAVARVTAGCAIAPPRFCPESKMSRAELAVFLVKSKRGASFIPPPARGVFSDVSPTSPAAPYIEQLFRDGVTSGCGPGVFCPDALVTRAEMAVLLVRMRRGAWFVPAPPTGVFADVPTTHWAGRYIEQLFRDRITNGCAESPRRFCPDSKMTRAQAAVFLQRTFSLSIP